jgi:hypothetical protein
MKTAKAPVVRAGQRKPYVKGTQSQIDERIGFVARMLVADARKSEIHQFVRDQFKIEWRQCDRYISEFTRLARARARGCKQTSIPESLANLENICGDKQK